jgi:hypothetical protein
LNTTKRSIKEIISKMTDMDDYAKPCRGMV